MSFEEVAIKEGPETSKARCGQEGVVPAPGGSDQGRTRAFLGWVRPPSLSPTQICETLEGRGRGGRTETCYSKLDFLGVMAWPVTATAIGACILWPQGADDEGAI